MGLDRPLCHVPSDVKGSSTHYARCERVFALEARCLEYHQPLEMLKTRGAVDYFCQHGHGLISRERVEFIPLVQRTKAFWPMFFSPTRSVSLRFRPNRLSGGWRADRRP